MDRATAAIEVHDAVQQSDERKRAISPRYRSRLTQMRSAIVPNRARIERTAQSYESTRQQQRIQQPHRSNTTTGCESSLAAVSSIDGYAHCRVVQEIRRSIRTAQPCHQQPNATPLPDQMGSPTPSPHSIRLQEEFCPRYRPTNTHRNPTYLRLHSALCILHSALIYYLIPISRRFFRLISKLSNGSR
jgi:hypothetical protein